MTAKLNIPEELQGAFRRLMKSLPDELQNNPQIQETTLVFLKFGGHMLARQNIEVNKVRYREEKRLRKKRLREEGLREAMELQDSEYDTDEESDDSDEEESDDSDEEESDDVGIDISDTDISDNDVL